MVGCGVVLDLPELGIWRQIRLILRADADIGRGEAEITFFLP